MAIVGYEVPLGASGNSLAIPGTAPKPTIARIETVAVRPAASRTPGYVAISEAAMELVGCS